MKFLGVINKNGVSFKEPTELNLNYKNRRIAVRFVVFDKDNKIALNHRPAQFGYKEQHSIPGGGVEESDMNLEEALRREAKEEIGCNIKDIKEIGYTIEFIDEKNLIQTTNFFLANVDGEKTEPMFTKEEKNSNLSAIWLPLDRSIEAVKNMSFGYVQMRSLLVLNWVKNFVF